MRPESHCDLNPDHPVEGGPVIECRNIQFSYHDGNPVLSDIGFVMQAGESTALCGPNGSGKTTLLKVLAGLLSPDRGTLKLGGDEITPQSAATAFRRIGIMFQDPNDQLFCSHVSEDVAFGLTGLGLPPDEIKRRVDESLRLTEAEHLAHRPIHHLSLGEMKRVALAGLIAMRAPLLVLDEPASGLDPASTRRLIDLVRHLNSEHRYAFLIVTHEMDLVPLIARRVLVLDHGKIVADGDVRGILTDVPLLERVRLEPPAITRYFFEKFGREAGNGHSIPLSVEEALKLQDAARHA